MFFYHIKFELYLPSNENSKDTGQFTSSQQLSSSKNPELFHVPTSVFDPLPLHSAEDSSQEKDYSLLFKDKIKLRETITSRTRKPASIVPAIPPTPVPEPAVHNLLTQSQTPTAGWKTFGK